MVELNRGGTLHYTAKFSAGKSTLPGAKQIYRYADHDVIALYSECNSEFHGLPLLRPVMVDGELIEASPSLVEVRAKAQTAIAALPKQLHSLTELSPYSVEVSPHLLKLADDIRQEFVRSDAAQLA